MTQFSQNLETRTKPDPGHCLGPPPPIREHILQTTRLLRRVAGVDGREGASQGREKGSSAGCGAEGTRGPPGLASPSSAEVPVVHSETGFDWQGAMGSGPHPLSCPTSGLTHRAGRLKGWKGHPLCPPRGQGSCFSREAKGSAQFSPRHPPGR